MNQLRAFKTRLPSVFIFLAMTSNAFALTTLEERDSERYGSIASHGYWGIGYEHQRIDLSGVKQGSLPSISILLGNQLNDWLDVELRGSTGLSAVNLKETSSGAETRLSYQYGLAALLKFNWHFTERVSAHFTTGYSLLEYSLSKTTTDTESSDGVSVGAGLNLKMNKQYGFGLDYLSYQRYSANQAGSHTWDSATLSFQYYY